MKNPWVKPWVFLFLKSSIFVCVLNDEARMKLKKIQKLGFITKVVLFNKNLSILAP